MRSMLGIGILLLLSSARADDTATALKELEGEWQVTEDIQGEQKIPADRLKKMKMIFKNGEVGFSFDGKVQGMTKVTIDPKAKPATIEWTAPAGPTAKRPNLGIYKLEKDKLIICMRLPDPTAKPSRPTEFKASSKTSDRLLTLERVKK